MRACRESSPWGPGCKLECPRRESGYTHGCNGRGHEWGVRQRCPDVLAQRWTRGWDHQRGEVRSAVHHRHRDGCIGEADRKADVLWCRRRGGACACSATATGAFARWRCGVSGSISSSDIYSEPRRQHCLCPLRGLDAEIDTLNNQQHSS